MEVLEHERHLHGVVAIICFRQFVRRAHPLKIRSCGEIASSPGDEDCSDAIGPFEGFECFAQRGDHFRVKGVVLIRAVDGYRGDPIGRGVDPHQSGLRVGVGNFNEWIGDRIGHVCLSSLEWRGSRACERSCLQSQSRNRQNYILKIPNRVSGTGALRLALIANPSTSLVWTGSIIPSSHI